MSQTRTILSRLGMDEIAFSLKFELVEELIQYAMKGFLPELDEKFDS